MISHDKISNDPMNLTKYLVRMDPPLSQGTARRIYSLKNLQDIEERDRRARIFLNVLKQCNTEEEVIRELGYDKEEKDRDIIYPFRPEHCYQRPSPRICRVFLEVLIKQRTTQNQKSVISELRYLEISDKSFCDIMWGLSIDRMAEKYMSWLKDNKYTTTEEQMACKTLRMQSEKNKK